MLTGFMVMLHGAFCHTYMTYMVQYIPQFEISIEFVWMEVYGSFEFICERHNNILKCKMLVLVIVFFFSLTRNYPNFILSLGDCMTVRGKNFYVEHL